MKNTLKKENSIIDEAISQDYKYGFVTDIEQETIPPGLSEDVIRVISAKKGEPDWLRDWRLKSYKNWGKMKNPSWAHITYPSIDYQSIMPEGWGRARGFSWGVVADGSRILRIAGQVGGERGDIPVQAGSDFGDQWERALGNLVEILRAGGGEPEHIVVLRAYVTDLDAFNASGAAVGAA